ncbi:unnamed protein product, partial [Timema podura]|nr:unnamed protein product [Timema podura]
CEYHGYNSDITRTWPISGKFSSNQLELYEAVLSVQSDLIKRCSNFPSLDSLFYEMCDLLGHSLQQVGLLPRNLNKDQLSKGVQEKGAATWKRCGLFICHVTVKFTVKVSSHSRRTATGPHTTHCADLHYTNVKLADSLAGHASPLTEHIAHLASFNSDWIFSFDRRQCIYKGHS